MEIYAEETPNTFYKTMVVAKAVSWSEPVKATRGNLRFLLCELMYTGDQNPYIY